MFIPGDRITLRDDAISDLEYDRPYVVQSVAFGADVPSVWLTEASEPQPESLFRLVNNCVHRFELVDGRSDKFWTIAVGTDSRGRNPHTYVKWGKNGTVGQNQAKSYPSVESAIIARNKIIAEKLDKGYVELVQ